MVKLWSHLKFIHWNKLDFGQEATFGGAKRVPSICLDLVTLVFYQALKLQIKLKHVGIYMPFAFSVFYLSSLYET